MKQTWPEKRAEIADRMWNYEPFEYCVVTHPTITPSDIDGGIAFDGKVMLLEMKDRGVPMSKGQVILYRELLKIGKGKIALLFIWCDGPNMFPADVGFYSHDYTPEYKDEEFVTPRNMRIARDQDTLNIIINCWFIHGFFDVELKGIYLDFNRKVVKYAK